MRIIEVEKCSPSDCPYCTPNSYFHNINYCDKSQGKSMSPVKTFPRFCPLKTKEEQQE